MSRQLIFTSAPTGLKPGRSGYCTVARDRSLPQQLVREIERISVLDLSTPEGRPPKVSAFRLLKVGSKSFCLLSRIRSAGHDYANRANYVAHHLVLEPREAAALPSPADILSDWDGWRDEWLEDPRYLGQDDAPNLLSCGADSPKRSITWFQWSGDEDNAEIPTSGKSIFRVQPGDEDRLLRLFAESSAKLDAPEQAWKIPFTTFLQPNEDGADFLWIGGWSDTSIDRLTIAKGTNSMELAPFDDEMAALTLSEEEGEIEEEEEEEEPVPSETPEPLQEEAGQPDQTDLSPEDMGPMPEDMGPMPKDMGTEVEAAAYEQAGQETTPQDETLHAEDQRQPTRLTSRQSTTHFQRTSGRRSAQPVAENKKSNARPYLLVGLAACLMLILGGTIYHLLDRIDELEAANAQLIEDAHKAAQWQSPASNQVSRGNKPKGGKRPSPRLTPAKINPLNSDATNNKPPGKTGPSNAQSRPVPTSKQSRNQALRSKKALEAILSKQLDKPKNAITPANFAEVEEFNATRSQITDLASLENATNLTALNLSSNKITDLTPLANLTKLTVLNLTNNRITDLTPLAKLTKLTTLSLTNNQVKDLAPLAGMTELTRLNLGANQVENLTPLAGLTNLKILQLFNNQPLEDLAPLSGLTKLKILSLTKNQISEEQKTMLKQALPKCNIQF